MPNIAYNRDKLLGIGNRSKGSVLGHMHAVEDLIPMRRLKTSLQLTSLSILKPSLIWRELH